LKILGVNPLPMGREAAILSSVLTLSAIAVIFILSPVLSSPLGPIDDHEYLKYRFHNQTGDLFFGLRQGLDRTWEEFTNEGRVRPVYQIGRTLTTSVIADNASIRYAFRLAIATGVVLALTASAMTRVLVGQLPLSHRFVLGITSTALSLAFLPWSDVVGRLGPPDSLGVLGLLLAFSALAFALRHPIPRPSRFVTAVFFSGLTIAAGARESYAIHSAILAISILLLHRSRVTLGFKTFAGLTFFCIYPLTSIIALSLRGGTDFYGQERTVQHALRALFDFPSSELFVRLTPVLAVWWLLSKSRERQHIVYFSIPAFAMMGADYLQYSTALDVYGRYRFISDAVFVIALLGTCQACLHFLENFRSRYSRKWPGSLLSLAVPAVLVVSSIPQLHGTRSEFEYASKLNRGYAMTISNTLKEIEHSSTDSVMILTDPMSDEYIARDLQERSLGIFWSVRSALPLSTNVRKSVISGVPSSNKTSFCIFVGITITPPLARSWSCKSFTQVF